MTLSSNRESWELRKVSWGRVTPHLQADGCMGTSQAEKKTILGFDERECVWLKGVHGKEFKERKKTKHGLQVFCTKIKALSISSITP